MINHFAKLPIRKELETKKAFDEKLTKDFINEYKKFIKNFTVGIKSYDIKLYGASSELEQN
ncbi:hypothetical protein FACS1894166_07780 [Bacilli bacterium]|nr:hypothetical protein FACS1894166_07780 [Bacilli bacterium]